MSEYIYELFEPLPRSGPGSRESTLRALSKINLVNHSPYILDAGCAQGKQSETLSGIPGSVIFGIDLHTGFLKLINRNNFPPMHVICADMSALPFSRSLFDLIWAEGSIYNIGFQRGLSYWFDYIKPGGYIGVSELTRLRDNPPQDCCDFWETEYPAIGSIDSNLSIIRNCGYEIIDHFTLPDIDWFNDFYDRMPEIIAGLRLKYSGIPEAMQFFDLSLKEIEIFRSCSDFYSYVFYIMKK